MACIYKYNDQWLSEEEILKVLSERKEFKSLYNNLLKELNENPRAKEVLDRIKRDYKKEAYDYMDYVTIVDEETFNNQYKEYYKDYQDYVDTWTERNKEQQEKADKYNSNDDNFQEEAIVELLGLMTAEKLDNVKDGKLISLLKRLLKEMKQFVRSLINQKEIEIDNLPDNLTINDLANILAYSSSKLILPGYEVEYTTPDNMKFKTYQEASNHISKLAKSVEDVDLSNIKISLRKKVQLANEIPVNEFIDEFDNTSFIKKEGKWYNKAYNKIVQDDDIVTIWNSNLSDNYINKGGVEGFIEKNKEYEQSKEIIEEWKRVNNIQYNPEEIYSRGQEFVSVVGAYSSFDVNLMMQNLLSHIEDNEKAGGKFAISAYTKPIDKTIGHLEGGGGKIKFKIYPKSEDILWASNTDVYSGSVWDASEKVNKDKKSELLGVSYTKYPSLQNVNTVQPNLAAIVDDLNHHHNELAIALTGNNFRLEYDEDIPYQTKKIIDSVNKILDQKYGKLSKPDTYKNKNQVGVNKNTTITYSGEVLEEFGGSSFWINFENGGVKEFSTEQELVNFVNNLSEKTIYINTQSSYKGIQPTQTAITLKESIDSVQSKLKAFLDYYVLDYDGNNWVILGQENEFVGSWKNKEDAEKELNKLQPKDKSKEYTEQALINTKIAKLKEVAKKYPRSLIRSEVRSIKSKAFSESLMYNVGFDPDELPFQKIPSFSLSKEQSDAIDNVFDNNPELANAIYSALQLKNKFDVILPIGTSGSGKSTFIKSLPQENLVVIEPDVMRVEFTGNMNDKSKDKEIYIEAAKRAIKAIKQGKQVVFDTTNLTKDKRLPFIEAIKKEIPNANIQYKLMELNPELAKQSIKDDIEKQNKLDTKLKIDLEKLDGNKLSEKDAIKLLEKLSKKYKIFSELTDDIGFNTLGNYSLGENRVRISKTTPKDSSIIHEFAHPFVEILYKENPKLFNEVFEKYKDKGNFSYLWVKLTYGTYYAGAGTKEQIDIELKKEVVTRLLETQYLLKQNKSLLEKILEVIKNFLYNKGLLKTKDFSKLNINTTIEELYNIFTNSNNFGNKITDNIINRLDNEIKRNENYIQERENSNEYDNSTKVERYINGEKVFKTDYEWWIGDNIKALKSEIENLEKEKSILLKLKNSIQNNQKANVSDETIDRHAESYKQMLEDIKNEPISNFEVTPQQKQQSKEIYQQYINSLLTGETISNQAGDLSKSQVKDIVYHGGKVNKDTFKHLKNKEDYELRNPNSIIGFFFSNSKKTVANQYAQYDYDNIPEDLQKALNDSRDDPEAYRFYSESIPKKPGSISEQLLNIKKPFVIQAKEWEDESWVDKFNILTNSDRDDNWVSDYKWTVDAYEKIKNYLKNLGYDSLYINSDQGLFKKTGVVDYITVQKVVFEPEQIHILSSKSDIEQAKEFINKNNQNTKFNISEKSKELSKLPNNQWFNKTIQPIINRFSKMFPNVRSVVISEKEIPNEVKSIVDGLDKQINSFFHKGQVYIIKERVTKDIAIEEFLHPFINALEQDNPELYKSLLLEAKKLFPELKEEVFTKYGKVYGSIFDLNREFLTQALTKKVSEQTPAQETFFQKFKSWIKDILNKLFGEEAFTRQLSELDEQMSLTDLASILNENNTQFNFNTDTNTTYYSLSEEEVITILNKLKGENVTEKQKELTRLILNNNKETEFIADTHEYFTNNLGEKVALKPVSGFLPKFASDKIFEDFDKIGNVIHDIAKAINVERLTEQQFISKYYENSSLKKFFVEEKGFPDSSAKQIISNIYSYISMIGKDSILISEVSISHLQDIDEEFKGVAGTIDLLEIKKDGSIVIHDFKSMYLNSEEKSSTNKESTEASIKFNQKKKTYELQLSLYKKLLQGIIPENKGIELQIYPIFYLAKKETIGNTIKVVFNDEPSVNIDFKEQQNYIFNAINNLDFLESIKKYKLDYNVKFANEILPTIEEPKAKKVLSKLEIDRNELLEKMTDKLKSDNSKELEREIEKTFKQVTILVKQYGNSENELNKALFKLFDPNNELKDTKNNFEVIFKSLSTLDKDDPVAFKHYLSNLVQYVNFIQEINVSLNNIKDNFLVIKSQTKTDTEKIADYRKSYLLAKSNKDRIGETLLQMKDISEDNLFKQMVRLSISNIEEIENLYYKETLPLIANTIDSYLTPELKQEVNDELTKRLNKIKYDLTLDVSESNRKILLEELELKEKEISIINDPNLISKMIKGEFGDGHWFYSNLVANINNSNYVISGTSLMMQSILKEISIIAIRTQDDLGKEFSKRELVYGVNRDQVKKMNEDLVTTTTRFFENADGTIEDLKSMTFITEVDQQVYEDLKKLEILHKNAKTDEEKEKTLKKIKDFKDSHFVSKYNPKYLSILNKIDVKVSDDRNIMELRNAIFNDINAIKISEGKENYREGNITPENQIALKELYRKLFNLSSSFDRNGNKKQGADLEIAEILQSRSAELEEFRKKEVDEQTWNKLKTKKIQELLPKYNNEEQVLKSEEYKLWQSFNTVISPTKEFYDERKKILEKINSILDKKEYKDVVLVGQLKDNLNQSWEKLLAISREYRDFEREVMAKDVPDGTKKAMKTLEENIDKIKSQIKVLEKSLSKQDKKDLNGLWDDYNSMVEYKNSKYYEEDLENELNKYALENVIELNELKNNKSLLVDFRLNNEWYINNHVQKEKFDVASQEMIVVNEPAYYYKVIIPTNSDYLEESPAMQYNSFELKDEAYNLDKDGKPNYLDVFGRLKVKSSSPYITENLPYLKLKNDLSKKAMVTKENLLKIQEYLEKWQQGANKNNLIYYQVPSKFKKAFERLSEGNLKTITQNIADNLFKMSNDEKEFGTRGVLASLSGEEMKFIPVLGKYKTDFTDQSYDVWQSLLEYGMSITKAKMFEEKLPVFDTLIDQLEKNPPTEDASKLEAIGSSLANKFNLPNITETIKGKGTNTLQAVRDEIAKGIYEEFSKELGTFMGVSDVKLTNTLLGVAGTTMMLGKVANWTVNALSGNIQVLIESAGKRYFNTKDVANAKLELGKRTKDVLEDVSKLSDKSLIGQLTDYFDPMKGEFMDELGNKFSWSKRTNVQKILFSGKIFGEWEMQMTTFIAMLKAKKVKRILPNGTTIIIDLYDAFEKGTDGIPVLKEGVQFTEKELMAYSFKIQGVNKLLNGSYAKIDQTKIEKYSLGKAAFFMKKYLVPLFLQRFGEFRLDLELQDFREGHYRIFYKTLLLDLKRLGIKNIAEIYAKFSKTPDEGGYTDFQKEGIRKTLTEFAIITMILVALPLLGYGDDDDDSDTAKYAQYIALKLKREVGLFTPLAATQELTSLIERPFIAVGAASNIIDLGASILKLPLNVAFGAFEDDLYYQRKTALWDEGDSKILSLALKTAGLQVAITNPEQLLQSYKYSIR